MSDEETTLRSLERAEDAIEAGELDEAAALLEQVASAGAELPERWFVEGTLASHRGDSEAAIAAYRRAAELAPDWPAPRIEAASEALWGRGAADEALELSEAALAEDSADASERERALFVSASALWTLSRDGEAMERLEQLAALDAEDPALRCETAHLFFELDAPERAVAEYRAALKGDPDSADAWYGLGHALGELGDDEGAIEAWLRTRALDLAAPRPPWSMSEASLEALAEETLAELPAMVRERLRDVPILVEDAPSVALVEDGVDPRLLGLFTGTPLPHKESVGGGVVGPDSAQLFLRNLENMCADRDELEAQVRITILHETAHFFGLEDDDLEGMGLG